MYRIIIATLLLTTATVVVAQEDNTINEPVLSVPTDARIRLDGDLEEWADMAFTTITTDGAELRFALAAGRDDLYIAATVEGERYTVNDADKLELYLNLTDDLERDAYVDGVYQLVLPAATLDVELEATTEMVDIHIIEGVTQVWELPPPAIIRGRNSEAVDPIIASFETERGWGIEGAVPLPDEFVMEAGQHIGFNIVADVPGIAATPLMWSPTDADNEDTPPAFGTAVFVANDGE